MTNKVLTNFRDHPALRFDDHQSVFKIDDKVYLIREGVVRQIIPQSIRRTNVGEPYRTIVRFYFTFIEDKVNSLDMESMDFIPKDEKQLQELFNEPQTLIESLDKVGLLS